MRPRAIALICLGIPLAIAACDKAVTIMGRGHEDVGMRAMAAVSPAAAPDVARPEKRTAAPASRQAEPSVAPSSVDGSCQTPSDALQSVVKTAPDATVTTHLEGRTAAGFIAQFRASTGADVDGDEVMLIQSANYGEAKVAVFAKDHCVQRTLAYQPSTPNHDQ